MELTLNEIDDCLKRWALDVDKNLNNILLPDYLIVSSVNNEQK